jgi:hypothetical protein
MWVLRILRHFPAKRSVRFSLWPPSSRWYNGVFERHTTVIIYCQIIRMWILHRQRGRYLNDETRRTLLGSVRVSVHKSLRSKFLYAPNGWYTKPKTADTYCGENGSIICLRLEWYCHDVVVQLEDTSRALTLTHLRPSDQIQGTKKLSQKALLLLGLVLRYFIILVDSRIYNILVS